MTTPARVLHAVKDLDADDIPYATPCMCPVGRDHWTENR